MYLKPCFDQTFVCFACSYDSLSNQTEQGKKKFSARNGQSRIKSTQTYGRVQEHRRRRTHNSGGKVAQRDWGSGRSVDADTPSPSNSSDREVQFERFSGQQLLVIEPQDSGPTLPERGTLRTRHPFCAVGRFYWPRRNARLCSNSRLLDGARIISRSESRKDINLDAIVQPDRAIPW